MRLTIILLLLFVSISSNAQSPDLPLVQEPGKCYAKCLIPAQYEEINTSFPLYIGNYSSTNNLDSIYFEVDEDSGNLIYFGHLEDFDHFQLDNISSFEKLVFLTDTTDLDSFIEEEISYLKIVEESSLVWKEVLCLNKFNSAILESIQEALVAEEYLEEVVLSGRVSPAVQSALKSYQQDNGLPIGKFDIETLNALGISF